jgi:hypothetical protein
MRLLQGLRAGLLAGSLAAASAAADPTYCNLQWGPGTAGFATAYAAGFWLCADAGTSGSAGWSSSVLEPDAAGSGAVSASQTGENGGVFEATASAGASAAPGLLRGIVLASSFAPPPDDGFSFARASGSANATMLDVGTVEPVGGAAPGTAVTLLLTIDVGGSFAGSADGDGQVLVYRNGSVVETRGIFVSSFDNSFFAEVDLLGFAVGDELALWMRLTAGAGASNEPAAPTGSGADLGNSGHLYLDVTSGNASFASASGHDYRAVPEPGAALLLAAGGGVLLGSRARRRSADRRG